MIGIVFAGGVSALERIEIVKRIIKRKAPNVDFDFIVLPHFLSLHYVTYSLHLNMAWMGGGAVKGDFGKSNRAGNRVRSNVSLEEDVRWIKRFEQYKKLCLIYLMQLI